jgi:hypothetical protein
MEVMATDVELKTRAESESHASAWGRPLRWARLLNGKEWLAVAVGAAALIQVLRARANYAPCAYLPLLLPALLIVFSQDERRRGLMGVRSLWSSLARFRAGGETPWAAAACFVAFPAVLLYLSNDRVETIGDTSTVVPTAISLLTEGNTDLDEFLRQGHWWLTSPILEGHTGLTCFLRASGSHVYPAHPSGMVPLALPTVALAKLAGARLSDPLVHLRLEKLTAAGIAALSMGVFFLLALQLVPPVPALTTSAMLAVASGLFSTVSQNLWQHDGIILGSLILLLLEFRGPGRLAVVFQGLICGTLPAFRLTSVTFLLPFGLWVMWRSPRRAAVMIGISALAFLPWAAYHQFIYASLYGPSSAHMASAKWTSAALKNLTGVLVSPGRGMVTYQPWILLGFLTVLPGVRSAAARGQTTAGPRGWAVVCLVAIALEIAVVSAWHCWWGGWCWGSRLVLGTVPFCALLCARPIAALITAPSGRIVVGSLALLSALVHVPVVYGDAFRWNAQHCADLEPAVRSWSDAPFLAPFTLPPRPRAIPAKITTGRSSSAHEVR